MAFTEPSQPQASSLVSFLDSASKTINGLMDKPNKGNKRRVNHKKFLQKRLQRPGPGSSGVSPAKPKPTTSTSAPHKSASKTNRVAQHAPTPIPAPAPAPTTTVAPFLHHNSWPQLPNYPVAPANCVGSNKPLSAPVEADLDFLIQQLINTPTEAPPQPSLSRPSSDSSLYPMPTFIHHQPPPPHPTAVPTSTLENQVMLGEQPYGSPYTPSNCSTDDIFDDSCYSSPCNSVYSSPAAAAAACAAVSGTSVSLANAWSPPCTAVTTSCGVPPTTTAPCDWGPFLDVAPTPCMVTCSELVSVTSAPMVPAACPVTLDQSLPTVPQLWDSLVFSDHLPY